MPNGKGNSRFKSFSFIFKLKLKFHFFICFFLFLNFLLKKNQISRGGVWEPPMFGGGRVEAPPSLGCVSPRFVEKGALGNAGDEPPTLGGASPWNTGK